MILKKIKASNGFLTAKGKIYDRGELFHSFLPGLIVGQVGGIQLLLAELTILQSGKKLSGHLKDLEQDLMYHLAGFAITYEVIPWLTSLL